MMRFFSSRVFLIGGAILALFIGAGFARAYYQHYQLQKEIAALQSEIDALGKKKLESITLLSYVMSPAFAEERARVELNMKKSGEHVVVVDSPSDEASAALSEDAGQKDGNPIKWWYYFSGKKE
jgi:cell division protein FtsB